MPLRLRRCAPGATSWRVSDAGPEAALEAASEAAWWVALPGRLRVLTRVDDELGCLIWVDDELGCRCAVRSGAACACVGGAAYAYVGALLGR